MKKISLMFAVIAILTLVSIFASAETPDECAARLDREFAISSYDEAAEWWEQVQRDCKEDPQAKPTSSSNYIGIYGWEGEFDFCVLSPTLNVRSRPGGAVTGRLNQGDIFTVDLASQTDLNGYVWAKHEKGWSALFAYPSLEDLAHPKTCPAPTATPRPTATRVRTVRSVSQAEALGVGQTKTFQLSGADCAITASFAEPGQLYFAAGRMGWLQDQFMVDIYAPGQGAAMSYFETEQHGSAVGSYAHQFYTPDFANFRGDYRVEISTFTESQSYRLQVNNKATYNIAVACE